MFAQTKLAGLLILFSLSVALAQEEPKSDQSPQLIHIGEIREPSSDLDDSLKFINEMTQLQQQMAAEYRTALAQIAEAQSKAANKVLESPDASDEQFSAAARVGLVKRVREVNKASEADQYKTFALVKRQLAIGIQQGLQNTELSNASTLASYLERYGRAEMAKEAYQTFSDMLKEVDNPQYKNYADAFAGSARRLNLLGNPIDLSGKLVDGSEFNWEDYQGKVVLVDFWATWCGPCIAEAPNVMANYKKYHDRGFEIVGISLDTKLDALKGYIEKNAVPWVNLYEDGAGWKHPMAVKYGVRAIPSVFLVDRDGKVVSLSARGEGLGKQLEDLLGSKADLEKAVLALHERIAADPDNAELICQRAEALTDLEEWDKAKLDWQHAVELNPATAQRAFASYQAARRWEEAVHFGRLCLQADPENSMSWLKLAPYLIAAGDMKGYREHCARMIEHYQDTQDARLARLTCKVCLLAPGEVKVNDLPIATFLEALEKNGGQWPYGIRAMLALRQGEPQAAVDFVKKSEEFPKVDVATATHLPILALAYLQLGEKAQAEQALQRADKLLKSMKDHAATGVEHDQLIAQILFDEAQAKMQAADKE